MKRKTLAGMLSEALCWRARRVSERRGSIPIPILRCTWETGTCHPQSVHLSSTLPIIEHDDDEIPFSRRAREAGRRFTGGKKDGEFFSSIHSFFFFPLFSFRSFLFLRGFVFSVSSSLPTLSSSVLSLSHLPSPLSLCAFSLLQASFSFLFCPRSPLLLVLPIVFLSSFFTALLSGSQYRG